MPLYQYKCKHCKANLDVLRTFDEYQIPPTSEEEVEAGSAMCLPAGVTDPDPSEYRYQAPHEWERHISGNTTILKSAAWGGGKGNWIALLAMAATALIRLTGGYGT
jgi:hypothetical protein